MKYLLLLLVASLCSCGVSRVFDVLEDTSIAITKVVDTTKEVIRKVDTVVAKVEEIKAATKAADTDGDGKLSIMEMVAAASLLLGSGTAVKVGMNKAGQRKHNQQFYDRTTNSTPA